MRQPILNLSPDAPDLAIEEVNKAYQEFPVKEETPEMRMFRMKAALKWNNVLLAALAKTGILTKECNEQMAENESLYL